MVLYCDSLKDDRTENVPHEVSNRLRLWSAGMYQCEAKIETRCGG